MTQAICIRCGAKKIGAFTSCVECGFSPATPRDSAESLLLTDHYIDPDELELVGEHIRNGVEIELPEELVAEAVQVCEQGGMPIGCSIAVWSLIAIMLGLAALVIFLAVHD